jgi:hypothetical protein
VIPGDILPTRARYSQESNDYQVGLNYLYARSNASKDGLWFALPDVVASVILTGRVPKIVDAFRIAPKAQLAGLRPITLRGAVTIDPRQQDFFRTVIEERKRLAANTALSDEERNRLDKALKVLGNATSYGIFAEMLREESTKKIAITCFGIDPKPFECSVFNPEYPGEYCFRPLASLITAAARLMLALLERCVTEFGAHAMADTDSMAIVATRPINYREILRNECSLCRCHCRDSIVGSRKGRAKCVTDRFEYAPAVLLYRRAQNRVVAPQGLLHRPTVAFPSRRAAFDIGEGKRHRTGR